MKKYQITYEVEIEAGDIDEAEELAEEKEEKLKKKARLKTIKGKDECWERFYETK
jgi:hypothetical protein